MRNIFYFSNVQKNLFKFNTRSKFKNYIDIDNLNYLSNGDIEVAVKQIIFDIDVKNENSTSLIYGRTNKRTTNNPILALRSSICTNSPFNNRYDNILCMFTSENIHQVEFKSPTFFPTHKELLSNAEFTIVNLKTGEQPKWDEGSPTCIHLLVRKRRMNKFNIFLESNDEASMLKFNHNNTNMEFTIALPERFRFGDWEVCLKSLILPSKIWNIYEESMPMWSFESSFPEVGMYKNNIFNKGSYEVIDILTSIQNHLTQYNVPIQISYDRDKTEFH